MTTLEAPEELVGQTQDLRSALPIVTPDVLPELAVKVPKTLRECRELAKKLAYGVVTGFIEHDRRRFDKCVESFSQVFLYLFPEAGPVRIDRASSFFVEALFKHDEIENSPGYSPREIIEDGRWGEVTSMLLGFSRTLGIPDTYATHTSDFWRYHGAGDTRYVASLLESDRILTTAIVGNGYWSKILGSLYLACVDCHDKHDPRGLEAGLNFAARYFEIILGERMVRSDGPEASSRLRRTKSDSIPIRVFVK